MLPNHDGIYCYDYTNPANEESVKIGTEMKHQLQAIHAHPQKFRATQDLEYAAYDEYLQQRTKQLNTESRQHRQSSSAGGSMSTKNQKKKKKGGDNHIAKDAISYGVEDILKANAAEKELMELLESEEDAKKVVKEKGNNKKATKTKKKK